VRLQRQLSKNRGQRPSSAVVAPESAAEAAPRTPVESESSAPAKAQDAASGRFATVGKVANLASAKGLGNMGAPESAAEAAPRTPVESESSAPAKAQDAASGRFAAVSKVANLASAKGLGNMGAPESAAEAAPRTPVESESSAPAKAQDAASGRFAAVGKVANLASAKGLGNMGAPASVSPPWSRAKAAAENFFDDGDRAEPRRRPARLAPEAAPDLAALRQSLLNTPPTAGKRFSQVRQMNVLGAGFSSGQNDSPPTDVAQSRLPPPGEPPTTGGGGNTTVGVKGVIIRKSKRTRRHPGNSKMNSRTAYRGNGRGGRKTQRRRKRRRMTRKRI
jgi:hypothetical protein